MSTTPKLGVGLLATNTAQKEVVVNEALVTFDALISRSALSRTNTPPGSPSAGDTYIVGTAPTGAWSGKANNIAFFFNGWRFIAPTQKMRFFVENVAQFWEYTAPNWAAVAAGTPTTLDDLANVGGAAPSNNDVLTFDSTTGLWLPEPVSVTLNLADLADVNLADLANGRILAWSAATSRWVAIAPPTGGGATTLNELTDVDTSGATSGQFLRFNGSGWAPAAVPTPPTPSLGDLTGVITAGAAPGDVLAWNGAAWGPSPAVITYSFLGMVDGPGTFDGAANKFLVVDDTESFMMFKGVDELFSASNFNLQNLGDVPVAAPGNVGQYLRLQGTPGNYSFVYATPTDTKVEVFNGPTQLTTAATRLTFSGFDLTEPVEGQIVITAKNALEFQADGDVLDGDEPYAINFTGSGVGVTNIDGVVTVTIENGGGNLETLDDVDLSTPPTDGQALVFDALTGKWVAGESIGSVGEIDGEAEAALYELGPFAPPTEAMFPLRWNAPSADVTEVKNRGLVVQPGPQLSGVRHAGISRALLNTDAPWVVTARLVPSGFQVAGHAGGIFLQRAFNSAAVFLNIGSSSSDTQAVIRFGSVNSSGTETIAVTEPNTYNWLRLAYDGNNILAFVSGDGLIWQLFGTLAAAAVLGGPPDRIGIENRSNAAHDGSPGVLVTYYDDPDFPAASRIQQGVVSLGIAGLDGVDIATVPPTDGQALVWDAENELWVPGDASGVSALSALTDVDVTTVPPIEGDALIWDSVQLKWVPGEAGGGVGGIATEFDISFFVPGVPAENNTVITYIAVRDFFLPEDLEGSFAYAGTAPEGVVVFTIQKNGTAIGSITFDFAATSATFTFASDVSFTAGDRLSILSPVGLQNLADLSITFAGSRT